MIHTVCGACQSAKRAEVEAASGAAKQISHQKEWIMSFFATLMIAGWGSAIALGCFYALSESGKLLMIRKRIASWLNTPEEAAQPEANSLA